MSMAEELADTHAEESADIGVSGASIPETVEKPEKPLSLRETLDKSVKEVREKEDRARDTTGKFAKKELEAPSAKTEKSPDETRTASVPSTTTGGPPPGWSNESKEFFNSLPPDHPIRKDVQKREEEVSNGFKNYSEKSKQYDAIEQVLGPVRSVFQQAGIRSDAEAIKGLVTWEASFRNPATRLQAFQSLAHQYGVNLSQFAQGSPQGEPNQGIPDQLRPVIDQFGNVVNELNSLKSEWQVERQSKVQSELTAFSKDKPHFEKVRVAMGQLMQAGAATTLDEAYQKAIWADQDVRNQLLKEEDDKRKTEFEKSRREAAQKAQQAAISPAPKARQGAPVNGKDASTGVRGSIMAAVHQLRDDQRA